MALNHRHVTDNNPLHHQQTYRFLIILFFTAPVFLACDTPIDSKKEQTKHFVPHYPASHIIQFAKRLKRGMSKEEVKRILGQPYHSPLNGLYYYSWKDSKSLVLNYRNQQDDITKKLQSFWIAKIGE
ncbi:MAG: hypothetical protein KAG20_02100 [Cocleimonas sp.]|nr:hypothetical protein [Cocleimonas sp.]